MMASNSQMRASDRDRDRTADLLREHHAAGRLDPEEFNERLDKVFTARTIGDLDDLTADLPAINLYPLPAASLPRTRPVSTDLPAADVLSQAAGAMQRIPSGWPVAWGSWALVTLLCGLLWLVTGSIWPLALAGAAGILMAGGWVARGMRGRGGPGGKLRLPHEPDSPPD
jgi:Domain of unknown function (DUF1707)